MQLEEIDRERAMSGWNPYAGEEELQSSSETIIQTDPLRGAGQSDQAETPYLPYFQQPDYTQILETQREAERSLRRLQTMYPESAKQMMPYVEDACDQMEYEGSPMFDEYPDRTTIYRLCERIRRQAERQTAENAQATTNREETEKSVHSMQYQNPNFPGPGCQGPGCPGPNFQGSGCQGPGCPGPNSQGPGCQGPGCPGPNFPAPGGPGPVPNQNPLGDLIQVLLLQEMHHRRCRYQQCRQNQRQI
jgi:hypothetical protein